jgi:hypothetical protein
MKLTLMADGRQHRIQWEPMNEYPNICKIQIRSGYHIRIDGKQSFY